MICNYCNGKGQIARFTHPTEGWQQPSFCQKCKGTGQIENSTQKARKRQQGRLTEMAQRPVNNETETIIIRALPCTLESLLERNDLIEEEVIRSVCRLKFKGLIKQKGGCLEKIEA